VPCGRATSKNDGAIENPLPRRADPARFPTLLRFFRSSGSCGLTHASNSILSSLSPAESSPFLFLRSAATRSLTSWRYNGGGLGRPPAAPNTAATI
jgi:hypothetical protein